MNIEIITRGMAVRNPINNISNSDLSGFAVKLYSWQNISQPALSPASNNIYCFMSLDGNTLPSAPVTYNGYIYTTIPPFAYSHFPQQKYYKETPWNSITHRVPFEF
jgi:hypothetical protein